MTFFNKYLKQLILENRVFLANPPLFIIEKGKKKIYCRTESDRDKQIKKLDGSYIIKRMKGIGEMNPEELKETTMNPTIRKLHCITIKDIEATEKILEELMGDNPETRKKYIIENSGVADVDM